jgi:hypothetical protein
MTVAAASQAIRLDPEFSAGSRSSQATAAGNGLPAST